MNMQIKYWYYVSVKSFFFKNWVFIEKLLKLDFKKSIHYAIVVKDIFCFE